VKPVGKVDSFEKDSLMEQRLSQESNNLESLEAIKSISSWVVVFAGLVYATGFIVMMAFSDFIGVREAPTEFFKAEFFYVGFLCSVLLIIVCGAIYGITVFNEPGVLPSGRPIYKSSLVLTFNLLFSLYIYMFLAPSNDLHTINVLLIFALTILGLYFLRFIPKIIVSEYRIKFENYIRGIFCIIMIFFIDYFACFKPFINRLYEIIWPRGIGFFLFSAVIVYIFHGIFLNIKKYKDFRSKGAMVILSACLLIPIYFLMVLSFGYTIYPNIPATRGGGDFDKVPALILHYGNNSIANIPVEINNKGTSQPLILIKESERWMYCPRRSKSVTVGGPKV
jgi:hypothetical protein